MELTPYIEDLRRRIIPEQEEQILSAWTAFADGRNTGSVFVPPRRQPSKPSLLWEPVGINAALEDDTLMLYGQLYRIHCQLASASSDPLCIRPNYGVGTLSSMLGAKIYVMPERMNTLPNAIAMGEEGILRVLDAPLHLLSTGYGPKVERMAGQLAALKRQAPELGAFLHIDHPDLQGPMDNCELLWGSDIFYALVDDPELVHQLLAKVTEAIERIMDWWLPIFPEQRGYACYFMHRMQGNLVIRNDSAMNLSPDMVREYILPYDSRLLGKYGGGIHFCGRGDHFIGILGTISGLHGVNVSQPYLNDMDEILRHTADCGIPVSILSYAKDKNGRLFDGIGHCAPRVCFTD